MLPRLSRPGGGKIRERDVDGALVTGLDWGMDGADSKIMGDSFASGKWLSLPSHPFVFGCFSDVIPE